jgi:thiamine kinase-like enzyme
MDMLRPLNNLPSIYNACDLITGYNDKLRIINLSPSIKEAMYSFGDIVKEGYNAFSTIEKEGLLSSNIAAKCLDAFEYLKKNTPSEMKYICHGDLSNKNILCSDDNRYILIDWEDAFLGIKDYDICYWLTFFDQRKLYSKKLMDELKIEKVRGISLMAVIILIKSYISFLNGSHNNSLSFNNRLKEIFLMY